MPMTYEEYVRGEKDKLQDVKFKQVRTWLKLALAKHIQEYGDGKLERVIELFVGRDPKDRDSKELDLPHSFLDEMLKMTDIMEEAFAQIGDAEEGLLASKLSSVSAIYMDRLADLCIDVRLNNFPRFKEKFTVDISEEQEVKNVVPRIAFKSIKMFLDRYYYVFRQCSVNPKARIVYAKLDEFRTKLVLFEYNIGYSISRVKGDHLKQIKLFYRDTKRALLMMRKFFEAVEDSQFGKMTKLLYDIAFEYAARSYVKYHPEMTIMTPIHKGKVVPMQLILERFDDCMAPIRKMVQEFDVLKADKQRRTSFGQENTTTFWDISSDILSFKERMGYVIDDFSNVVSPTDNDLKFFTHTVQMVIIPYMNQSRGEVNETFATGVKNLDLFFWKVTIKIIEMCQDEEEKMEEVAGLVLKLKPAELVRPRDDEKAPAADVDISDSVHTEIT